MNVSLWIHHQTTSFSPALKSGVTLESQRTGEPASLKFTILYNSSINVTEGDSVAFSVDGVNMFFGFIFSIKKTKEQELQITAYDQLRYLKNKDTYVYENKTASQLIKMIADDYRINVGSIKPTSVPLTGVEDNQTLFDIIQNALDETLKATGNLYVLYDKFGELTLTPIDKMITNVLITDDTAEDYEFNSSINDQTYNQIKIVNETDSGTAEYVLKDSNHINDWGLLQYYEKVTKSADPEGMAEKLLELYNSKTRELKLKSVFGNTALRAGMMVPVKLTVADIQLSHYLLCESVKHTFDNGHHYMDLILRGGALYE